MTIWRMRIACWVPKATHTHTHSHSQYTTLTGLPLQQWFARTRLNVKLYVHCLSCHLSLSAAQLLALHFWFNEPVDWGKRQAGGQTDGRTRRVCRCALHTATCTCRCALHTATCTCRIQAIIRSHFEDPESPKFMTDWRVVWKVKGEFKVAAVRIDSTIKA